MQTRPTGHVVLLTDFGDADPYVGILRGAVLRANPRATLVDLGHTVPAHDVIAGAFWLWAAQARFPNGSVVVAVVDPGVGTSRRLLAVAAQQMFWIAPDNGLLSHVLAADPSAEIRELDPRHLQLPPASATFHGRDILGPVAGWLSGGRYGFSALGARIADPVRLSGLFDGPPRILHVDGYGNLVTNLPADGPTPNRLEVAGRSIAVHRTYGDVAVGDLLALVGSFGLWEIAEHGGSAARTLGVGRNAPVRVH